MEQDIIVQKENPTSDEIWKILRETSQMMREAEEKHQAEYERRQQEYAEYERKIREAEERREAGYQRREADYKRREEERERKLREAERRREEEDRRREADYQRRQAEFERDDAAYKERAAKADRQMEELRQQMKETDEKMRKMEYKYTSQMGHVVEGLMEPSAMALFQQSGFDISKCWKNMKGKRKDLGKEMEVDLFLFDTTDAVAVEVKTNCCKDDVEHFLKQMEKFSDVFPNFAGVNVYLAIAAINFDYEADKYAAERGLFVIHVREDVFSLDPAKKEDMTYFYKGKCHVKGVTCEKC